MTGLVQRRGEAGWSWPCRMHGFVMESIGRKPGEAPAVAPPPLGVATAKGENPKGARVLSSGRAGFIGALLGFGGVAAAGGFRRPGRDVWRHRGMWR
jgi:hypothetical protein